MLISSTKIRKDFIDFFKNKSHKFVRSSPVVPIDDPTLLFTNAGMNQFKPYFLGAQKPKDKRVVNSQKCIRVSGKHNDLEEVGVDNYHHTFFEMLGNWSFGDYYKENAITWAWELLTEVWKLDKSRLWVTIFKDDDESRHLWEKCTDINPGRILKFGHKDNFWEMGQTGPCGPCTEIHYYTGKDINSQLAEGVNKLDDYREIWNLVFIQYNRSEDGALTDLPDKHVDTGAGLERLVAILNNKSSNYDTDLFSPIINEIINISGKSYEFELGVAHRVIADHVRMISFSIADGTMPGNDGRGYVVRRVLRRAARFGRKLDIKEPFLYKLVKKVREVMGKFYPELDEKFKHIEKIVKSEENSFNDTLDRGIEEYKKITKILSRGDTINGNDVFKLYDTFGFPLDLTKLMAKEDKLSTDDAGFKSCMDKQREQARSRKKFSYNVEKISWKMLGEEVNTEFLGYKENSTKSKVIKYFVKNKECYIVLDRTPFYAESGGQVSDIGSLKSNLDGNKLEVKVKDVQKNGEQYIHFGEISSGVLSGIEYVNAEIDINYRESIKKNHTATHILHQSLKDILGMHVQQAGSLVRNNNLRFDLTHHEKISQEDLIKIETLVNKIILDNKKVNSSITDFQLARDEGAISLFGEKYGDKVRVVDIPGFSKELCGGTHVMNTGDIGSFKIISESSLSSGVRRIVAVTGLAVYELIIKQQNLLNRIRNILNCSDDIILEKISDLLETNKNLKSISKHVQGVNLKEKISELISLANKIHSITFIIKKTDYDGDLKEMGDEFLSTIHSKGLMLVGTVKNNKPMLMCAITSDLTSKIQAGKILSKISKIIEGGGGGKAHLATAGGRKVEMLDKALADGESLIKSLLI